jgi:hypothetical protein
MGAGTAPLPTHHRRNHFKHSSGCCPQRRAALKSGINTAGIVVINTDDSAANRALRKLAVAEIAQVF